VHDIGLPEALRHVADLPLQGAEDVAGADHGALVVQDRRAGQHRRFRVEHRRQDLVLDLQRTAAGLGGALALGDHRGDALAREARDIVEQVDVVGIDEMVLVQGRAEEAARDVFPGVDGDHAGNGLGPGPVDARDAGMGVRRAQHLQVQQSLDRDVHRVACRAGQDGVGERIGQAGAAGLAGNVFLDIGPPVQGVDDRAIARAAAEISLQGMRQVVFVRLVECSRRHDHAGGAEAALEGLGVMECLLQGMQRAISGKAFDSGDLAALAAEGGDQAGVERLAVDVHRAGAAVARVAAFLDAEDFQIAQEGAQALAGLRLGRIELAVDLELAHASSARICSAK